MPAGALTQQSVTRRVDMLSQGNLVFLPMTVTTLSTDDGQNKLIFNYR